MQLSEMHRTGRVKKKTYKALLIVSQACKSYQAHILPYTQPAFNCSKLTKETLKQSVKYVQN